MTTSPTEPEKPAEEKRLLNDASAKRRLRLKLWTGGVVMALALLLIAYVSLHGASGSGIVGRLWQWLYYTPPAEDPAVLIGIASVAVVVWTGGLVAFTLQKRYPANLSNGMWILVAAFIAPLIALVVSGATLRTIAVVSLIVFGTLAVVQIEMQIRLRRMQKRSKLQVTAKPLNDKPGEISNLRVAEIFSDSLDRAIRGGLSTGATALLSLLTIAFGSGKAIAIGSIALLATGLVLVFQTVTAEARGEAVTNIFTPAADPTDPDAKNN